MKSTLIISTLIILVLFSCRRKSSDDYEYYKPFQNGDSTAIDTILVKDTIEAEVAVLPKPEPVEIRGVVLTDSYFIVVASYTVEEFALAQKNDLTAQGYKPQLIMTDDDGWFKLAVESYPTLAEAKKALIVITEKGGLFAQSRIVFRKNK